MKKPEEIITGLRCMSNADIECDDCPYNDEAYLFCSTGIVKDAIAIIQQYEAIYKLAEERGISLAQAVEDIRKLALTGEFICPVCAHYNHGEGTKGECVKCLTGDGFRWRGER